MTQIFDPIRVFGGLKNSLVKGISDVFPIETENRLLRVSNVKIDDKDNSPFDYKKQKAVRMAEGDFVAPIYGDVELVDKRTGKVLDKKKNFRLMDVPVLTDRYSYILGGNEYTVDKQLRMKPGIYTREKENGELESQFNLAKGGGRGFKLWLNPEDGVFKLKIGTANPPLYPLLKSLGVEDNAMQRVWGDRLFKVNQRRTQKNSDKHVTNAYKAIFRKDPPSMEQAKGELKEFFDSTILSEETTKRTLGKPFAKVEPETLLLTSKRLLEVSRGEAEPDDRDSLVFKHIYNTPDLVTARLDANKRKVHRNVSRVMDKKNKVTEIISKDLLNRPIRDFFVQGTVAHAAEQTNPTTILAEATKVTSLGEGAIGDMNAITESMRAVNSSHAGVLDPVATPESDRIGINLHLALGAGIKDKELQTIVVDPKTKKTSYENIKDIFDKTVAFPDQYDLKSYSPKNKMVTVMKSGKITDVPAKEVDLVMRTPKQIFSYLSNLVPFSANVQGNRAFMANKMLAQAIPLKHRESPLVQTKMPTGGSFEKFLGNVFSTSSEVDGEVTLVTNDEIKVKSKDGELKTYNVYNNFPLNNKAFIHSTPLVKAGDKVTVGQSLADTNYTKDGNLAIGTNLKVGILPFRDNTFEDGYVISETASKKLTSEHLKEISVLVGREDVTDLKSYQAHYPTALTGTNAGKLDSEGVIRKGQKVEPGDIIIAHLQRTEASEEDARLGKLTKKLVKGYRNNAQIWDKETVGEVVDVYKTGNSIKVLIRSDEPMQIGDKLVNRHGAKGIVSCFDNETEILTDSGWKLFKDLKEKDRVCTLNPKNRKIEYHVPDRIIDEEYCGPMHVAVGRRINFCTTPNHKHYVKDSLDSEWKLKESQDIYEKKFCISRKGKWSGKRKDTITIPEAKDGRGRLFPELTFAMDDFLFFFGFFITEGNISGNTGVRISQSKSVNPKEYRMIYDILVKMGLNVTSNDIGHSVRSAPLAKWLSKFGLSHEKYIPREFLKLSKGQLNILLKAMLLGDGHEKMGANGAHSKRIFYTASKRLADDVQELAFKAGVAASISIPNREKNPYPFVEYTVNISSNKSWVSSASQCWEHYEGRVHCVDVRNHIIYVRRGGRVMWSGNSIVPDKEMPMNSKGENIDVALSPSAIPGRINPSQVLEAAASKVAKKRGKALKIDNFSDINSVKEIKSLLKKEGLEDKEELIDPTTGQSLGKVMVGDQYYLKLMHQVSKKMNSRGTDAGYDIDMRPTKGGHGSAQAMDRLTWNSLVAHGARENLFEMSAYKAEKNPELWRNVKLGLPLPAPKKPFVFNKLMGYLAAGGVNIKKDGNRMYMLPMTDEEILSRSNGEIDDAKVVVSKNLRPVRDGLFDDVKTGGLKGTKWTHVALAEPVLNPVMENAAMTLLDLTKKQFNSLVNGEKYWDPTTNELTKDDTGWTSGLALEKMLSNINVDKEYKDLRDEAPILKGQGLDKANKKLRFLNALRKSDMKPEKAYMLRNIPILPPQFRPMYPLPNGALNTAPINYLYRDMIMVNKQLKNLSELDDENKSELRRDLYQAVKASQGLGDPLVQRGQKKIVGAIELIKGDQPKEGFFQSIVFSKNQDLSGRSTITPSTEMNPDEILLPKDMAWDLYQPFVVKEMISMGYKPLDAMLTVREKDPRANLALEKVSKERPMWINRAPSLHKFSTMAFMPKLYEGKSIKIHPLVVGGFNADFDGDTMAAFVPVSHKAVEEAKKFLPTRVLEHAGDSRVMLSPIHDIMTGMYYLTKTGKDKSGRYNFKNVDEAMKLFKTKAIEANDTVVIAGKKTSIGKELVSNALPADVPIPEGGINKASIKSFLKTLSKKGPDEFKESMDKLSKLASEFNITSAISIGLNDLEPDYSARDKFLKGVKSKLDRAKNDDEKISIIQNEVPKFHKTVKNYMERNPDNALSQLMVANGKPSFDQFKQLISTPFAVSDTDGKAIPIITTKSFAEGLPVSEYWTTTYGSRSGMIQKRLETAEPGYFAKQVLSVTLDNVISTEDCGTRKGVETSMENKNDVVGRYEAGTNRLIDDSVYTSLLKEGRKFIKLRSPLKCQAREGTCSKCYGLRENGQNARIGDNVGALAGQFFTEPTTQGAMKAFHTGAVLGAGAQVSGGLERLKQLTLVPDYLKDKATLSATSGKVDSIHDNPAGGKNIFINGKKHLVGVRNVLKVKEGDEVAKGDALTDGPIKPQELLKLKGIGATQKYLVDSMKETFSGMGVELNRKLIETVVKSTTDLTTITDPGEHPFYNVGDKVNLSEVNSWNSATQNTLHIDDALDAELATGVGPYKAGTKLDRDKVNALKSLGHKEVIAKSAPVKHSPSIIGVNLLARSGKDWLAKLNTNYIQQNIIKGVQTGDVTEESSYNPTAPYVLTTGFGKGKSGKY